MSSLIERIEAATGPDSFWDEVPYVRKTGRYLFFALCGFGLSIIGYLGLRRIGVAHDFSQMAANAVWFIAFLTLRDMSKQWDAVLMAHAKALRAREASHEG